MNDVQMSTFINSCTICQGVDSSTITAVSFKSCTFLESCKADSLLGNRI